MLKRAWQIVLAQSAMRQELRDANRSLTTKGLARCFRCSSAFDFGDVAWVELELAGAHHALGLLGISGADDGATDGGEPQRPGDGYFTRRASVTRGNRLEALDEFEVLRKVGFAELRAAAAPVILGKFGGTFARHRAGQQTGSPGRLDNDTDSLTLAIREDFRFDLTANQRIGRL
jgi:hypothetical protein